MEEVEMLITHKSPHSYARCELAEEPDMRGRLRSQDSGQEIQKIAQEGRHS